MVKLSLKQRIRSTHIWAWGGADNAATGARLGRRMGTAAGARRGRTMGAAQPGEEGVLR
jgi:hypothetical protein